MSGAMWVKLDTHLFANPKIAYLKAKPNGAELVLLWVCLLCRAGRINDGGRLNVVPFESFPQVSPTCGKCGKLPDDMWKTPEISEFLGEISAEIGQKIVQIRAGFEQFFRLKMVGIEDGFMVILGWYDHQSVESMEEYKAKHAERSRAYRQRKREAEADLETFRKELQEQDDTPHSVTHA